MAPQIDTSDLRRRLDAVPGLEHAREAAARAGVDAYVVGGTVRDLLLGLERADLDIVVVGDNAAMVRQLGGEARSYERFGTATVALDDHTVDVASARREIYPHPGALPEVSPGALADDLARRDFTVNAMAIPLAGEAEPIDPHGGMDDLAAGTLRALHERSFVDDPTRALRAARYAARLDFDVEPGTLAHLRQADLAAVSAERVEAELRRLACEPDPIEALGLVVDWGLAEANVELAASALAVLERGRWGELADRAEVLLAAGAITAGGFRRGAPLAAARELVAVLPERPSVCVRSARGKTGVELVLARALAAEWLDDYVERWRDVRLEISGDDLLSAGVAQGPAIGHGLEAALGAKLDGEVHGHAEELRVALDAARELS
jgi:tRNA nucleotidyltransferase (CCA-adding enzyme)